MSEKLNQLTNKLKELFQLNRPDLDFGIYRIMHAKQTEIERFLEKDLLPQVKDGLATLGSGKQAEIKAEIEAAIKQAEDLGVEKPEETKKVRELRAKYGSEFSEEQAEDEIYSHLYNFFARYYQDGDFMSMRRYKEGVYAIPYEGEEVYLHWANKDQYYIKTSENLKNYTFKLDDGRKVTFRVLEADTEKDNKKAADDKDRRFILNPESITQSDDGQILILGFEYRPDDQKRNQSAINEDCVAQIQFRAGDLGAFTPGLLSLRPTDKRKDRTLLEKHLEDYTAKHTFDYFIHKDLGNFLRRELDFYIKNEVMHLDDIEHETAQRVEQYLTKVKVIRKIAGKIIDFLAQLENFQKKLWLKKKFVVETNYCITLDRVPDELYPEIAANDAQWEEWEKLGFVDLSTKPAKTKKGELDLGDQGKPAVKTSEYLKAFPFLVVDTSFYDDRFKEVLLSSLDGVDAQCEGILLNAESFQALMLLKESFRKEVKCVYIDPPYNKGNDFAYKDSYQHSSWLSSLRDKTLAVRPLLSPTGIQWTSLDENEAENFHSLMQNISVFNESKLLTAITNLKGIYDADGFVSTHEYVICATVGTLKDVGEIPVPAEALENDWSEDDYGLFKQGDGLRRTGADAPREKRPNGWFPVFVDGNESIYVTNNDRPRAAADKAVYPVDSNGNELSWSWSKKKIEAETHNLILKGNSEDGYSFYKKQRPGLSGIPTRKSKSFLYKPEYSSTHGGNLAKDLFGKRMHAFTPKSVALLKDLILLGKAENSVVLDHFAGSGTTGHAVIDLNRGDNGQRRYILVEMGDHFDTALKPRIQKVIYSQHWFEGSPTSADSGISHCFKYIRLESYEDCLNNLKLSRSADQDELLLQHDDLREDYMLNYMLDVEAKGSVLNIDAFEDPFAYKMNIATGTVGETKPINVDLVETFNYLIGLKVKHIDNIRGVRVITGENLAGERILVLWRKVKELNSDALDEWFKKQGYNTQDMEFDLIYVNGDNNLENLKKDEHTWKVRLIEEEFHHLMFEEVE